MSLHIMLRVLGHCGIAGRDAELQIPVSFGRHHGTSRALEFARGRLQIHFSTGSTPDGAKADIGKLVAPSVQFVTKGMSFDQSNGRISPSFAADPVSGFIAILCNIGEVKHATPKQDPP